MVEEDGAERISFEQTRQLYRVWRWRLEQPTSMRFVTTWSRIGGANLDEQSRLTLADVAWALAALERSWAVLAEDIARAEAIESEGAPAVMHLLSGPFEGSLWYLLGASLWMDLGDVLAAYRTLCNRFGHLRGPARRGALGTYRNRIEEDLSTLEQRRVPALGADRLPQLANTVLHESWHPAGSQDLAFRLYWKEEKDESLVDFAEGPVIDQLRGAIEDTVAQVAAFFDRVLGVSR